MLAERVVAAAWLTYYRSLRFVQGVQRRRLSEKQLAQRRLRQIGQAFPDIMRAAVEFAPLKQRIEEGKPLSQEQQRRAAEIQSTVVQLAQTDPLGDGLVPTFYEAVDLLNKR